MGTGADLRYPRQHQARSGKAGGTARGTPRARTAPMRCGGVTMPVTRTEKHATKGLRTLSPAPNASGLYSEMFMVEPTTQCNLKCPLCPVPTHMHRPGFHMQMHTYRDVVDDIAGHAKLLALWNFGEPFLNPEIFEMIRYAEERHVPVRVSTNSTFLGEHEVQSIFDSDLSSIIVCLDGASKETHERYRIGSTFELVR